MITATCKGGSPGVGLQHQVLSLTICSTRVAVRCVIIPLMFFASWVGHPQGWVVLVTQHTVSAIRKGGWCS